MIDINTSFQIIEDLPSSQPLVKYRQVIEKDRLIIEKSLNNFLSTQALEGDILPLNGGKSGDSLYIANLKTKKFAIRIMPKNHLEAYSKQLAYSKIAAQKQVGPAVLYHSAEDKVCMTEFVEGVPLTPNLLEREDLLLKLSGALREIHEARDVPCVKFNFVEGIACHIKEAIRKELYTSNSLNKYLSLAENIGSAINKRNLDPTPCHNDIHTNNIFCDENQYIKLIDLGDAALGDYFFDLARASIEFYFSQKQI